MKLGIIIDSVSTIKTLMEQELPINTAIKLVKLSEEIEKYLVTFENKRKKIVEPLGEKPEKAPKEAQEQAVAKISELLGSEVDFEFNTIKYSELGDIKISPALLSKVTWLFTDD